MDWEMQTTSVVIVGAGFSAAASDGKMPLMTGFFDQLTKDHFPELFEFVSEVGCSCRCPTIAQANVESVLTSLDQMRTAPVRALRGTLAKFRGSFPSIQAQLTSYTLNRLKQGACVEATNWAAQLLACCGFATTVISMNYDNLAESILSNRDGVHHGNRNPNCPHCRMRLLLSEACSCNVKSDKLGDLWRGAILKPHGSVAWRRCLNNNCCNHECLVADQNCRPFEPCKCNYCDTECAPVMVLPTMSKNLGEIREIAVMWDAAYEALKHADSLLLFGFSLPKSDELLTQTIRSAVSEGRKLKKVASIDLNPEAVLHRFEDCLPHGIDVDTTALPVQVSCDPIWLPDKVKQICHEMSVQSALDEALRS
jgi:NAD-dependent SIR2 family protein deacetylase